MSRDLNNNFRVANQSMQVMVLTSGCWPFQGNESTATLPPSLEAAANAFTQFYNTQHSGRKLTWCHQFSKAEVKVAFIPGKNYELTNLNVMQTCILMLYNYRTSVKLKEVWSICITPTEAHRMLKVTLLN